MKLKSLAAALCVVAAGQAHAATTSPGSSMLGDVIFQASFGTGGDQVTLNWDLSLTSANTDVADANAKSFLQKSVSYGTVFGNSVLDSFIGAHVAAGDVDQIKWRVLGAARDTVEFGALTTSVTAPAFPGSKTALTTPVNTLAGKIGGLGTATPALDNNAATYNGSSNNFAFNTVQADTGFGSGGNNLQGLGSLAFWYVHKNPSTAFSNTSTAADAVLENQLGTFALSWDAGANKAVLAYTAPVPVPGAVWMLGSGLAALAARRRRA